MRRLFGGNTPLSHSDTRVTEEGYFAVAPVLLGNPFYKIVAVTAVLGTEEVGITFGMPDASGVHVSAGVSLMTPVTRVG